MSTSKLKITPYEIFGLAVFIALCAHWGIVRKDQMNKYDNYKKINGCVLVAPTKNNGNGELEHDCKGEKRWINPYKVPGAGK